MVISQRIAPPVQRFLEELLGKYAPLTDGEVATYIPELSKANPEWFGISVVTLDGHEYGCGDAEAPFTIQSVSKPFVYGMALEAHGEDYVLERVGLEPTGDAFNAISLDPNTGRPANAMINAGAIAAAGMIAGGADPAGHLLGALGRYAGRALEIDEAVYRSESDTGHRNRAISHLLKNNGIIATDPESALDLYFKQCSVAVTCRDLARMAACLANNGVNPVTGERAIPARYVDKVLSVMGSCGMYDYAGEWIYRVGMPAKSGVAGGVLAVLPGQLGIGVFSPRLDSRGNSVRGVGVCTDLSEAFNLHLFNVPQASRAGVRASYHAGQVHSKRERTSTGARTLRENGERIRVYELQGDQAFAAMETFTRSATEISSSYDYLVVELRRVSRMDTGAAGLLSRLVDELLAAGKTVAISSGGKVPALSEALAARQNGGPGGLVSFATLDLALEWCEDRLLSALLPDTDGAGRPVPMEDNALMLGLLPEEIEAVESVTRTLTVAPGEFIIEAGATGDSVFMITRGNVSIVLEGDGESLRVATLPAGLFFGEMAVLGERARAASVRADSEVECRELSLEVLRLVASTWPNVRAVIALNIARKLADNLRDANRQISALSA
jgi:glutaminase